MQPFDCYGDHAACCKRNSDIIVRHNRLRNLVHRFAEEGLLSPVLEKRFLFGPTSVTVPCWRDSKGLAVDVAVTSTFSRRNISGKPSRRLRLEETPSTTRASGGQL